MTGEIAIEAQGIAKTYGTGDSAVTALRGVDLSARFGEMVALVGPSGCGKTTFISILAGLLSRDGGQLRLAGVDPDALDNHARTLWRRGHVGFIFQFYHLLPELNLLENVLSPLMIRHGAWEYWKQRKEFQVRACEIIQKVGLDHRCTEIVPPGLRKCEKLLCHLRTDHMQPQIRGSVQSGQVCKRRSFQLLSMTQLARCKPQVVVPGGILDHWFIGTAGLNDHASPFFPTPRATGDLRDQLKCPFAGP